MIFQAFKKTSLIEYPGKISSIVWTAGCTFNCPFCYNADLINIQDKGSIQEQEILDHLSKNKHLIDALSLTGGEPTVHHDLPQFLEKVKKLGLLIQIETNGTNPVMLKQLIDKKLADYIAMDVKASLKWEKYSKIGGIKDKKLFENVKKSIKLIIDSKINHEFRTTVIPKLHTKQDILDIAKSLKGAKAFYLQQFKNDVPLLNKELENTTQFSRAELEDMWMSVKDNFKVCGVRS